MTPSASLTPRPIRSRRSRRATLRSLLLLPLLALPLAGCATKRDVRNLQATLQETHAQNQTLLRELQRVQGVQGDSIRAVSNFLLNLRGDIAGRFAAVENEIIILQGLQGVSQQQLATLRDAVEQSRPTTAFGTGGGGMTSSGASELYDRGMAAFSRGSHSSAELAFREIVTMHAGDPLVPDAKFYLALIQVEYEEREAAITSFRDVAESYPSSPRAPEALYRLGMLYLAMENRTEALTYFNRVADNYPSSDSAALARTQLQNLR